MAGSVVVEQSSVSVEPGQTGSCTVRVRNTGTVIDQFTLTVLGQPAAWTTVVPAALSLFPGADGTIELHFAPPRAPGVGSGPTPFGVRIVGSEDPDNPVVEEGEVNLLPFVDVNAKLTPRTTEAKRKSKHEIVLDNKGNTDVVVSLSVSDPDEQLAFALHEPIVTVPAGQSTHVPLKVAAKKGFARGADKHRPFQVKAVPEGGTHPLTMDGNLIQKPGMPSFILPLVAGVVALGLIAALLPALTKNGGKGNLQLASEDAATTTTAEAPAGEEAPDENAPATAEEAQAAAAAELAANGKDPNAPTGVAATGTGDSATATTAAPPPPPKASNEATDSEPAPVTSVAAPPPAPATTAAPPPGSPTTTAAATTTTAPRDIDMYYVIKQEDAGQAHYHWFTAGQTVGQTFKANAPVLTEAWLNLSGPNITFNVRKAGPGGAIVASSAATPIVQFGWTKATFPRIPLTVGAAYYLEGVFSGSGYGYAWYSNTNDYPDGDGFANGAAHGHDLNARVIGRTS